MAVPNTRQRAKELVQQIAKNHGYLGEEKLRAIEPELRREIEEAFLKKDEMIGSSVITLAKNLYTSKARFVFELLQNADDNNYAKAAALGAAPCVSFRVFPRQIIMECNEDGFTNENLEAICSVGKSSKTGSQGYIGEKGIGFKSVFMAAWKAHIQSGSFSFSFSHRNGESGMGMISPIWEETQEERDSSLTRLTLHLHDTGDSDALEKTHQIIKEQFQELQETILLFMKNLRIIRVAFHGIDGAETSSAEYSIQRPEVNHAVLKRAVIGNGNKQEYVKHYDVTVHQATDIPRHENRTYSGQADHTSQVVLAFPLSETSVPVIEPQDIFVYLPVRPAGFKFIIQADFVTDASRQDIVKDSLRNIALLDGVADAFARAVLQFCGHDGLRLQWMRRTLFRDLGVQKAPISLVRRKILEMYKQPWLLPDLSVQTSKQHLEFLYLSQHLESENEPSYSLIFIFDQDECIRKPPETFIHLATDKNPYSPWELLKEGGSTSSPGCEAPGFMAHYMNEAYFLDPPQTPQNQTLTWVEWFHSHLKIPKYVYFGDTHLSDAAKYLQKYRPERFLGALRMCYLHNGHFSSEFIASVQNTKILCRGDQQVCLKDAYVPIERLETLVTRFVEDGASFPWLWLDTKNFPDTIPEDWDRLIRVLNGGKVVDDLDEVFEDANAIYIPPADSSTWVSPEDCVWSAAQELQTKFVLEIVYEPWLSTSPEKREDVKRLFCDTLGIFDCTVEIYVEELKSIRNSGSEDSDIITTVYEALDSLWQSSIAKELTRNWLRGQFEDHALIYVVSNEGPSWRKTSQCVWSTAAQLRDMVSLNNDYEELHDFFVDALGVRPVTLNMAIKELKQAGSRRSVAVEEVKATILTVNSLLCSEPNPDQKQRAELEKQREELAKSKIFPVRHPGGVVQCVAEDTEFFVVDLEPRRSPFENRVKLLDFSLEEAVRLRHFFKWARIEDRYISLRVRQFTSVEEAGAQQMTQLDRQFRYRAHALLRIAEHFESPRVTNAKHSEALYGLLRNAKIFATDKIFLELSLSQDGSSHNAQGGSLNVHLHEHGSDLKVYLPRRKSSQQFAFSKHLPERILQWLMTDAGSQIRHETSFKAVSAIKDVWNAPLEMLSTTLDESGIMQISTLNVDEHIEELSSDTDSDGDDSEVVDTPASVSDTMPVDSPGTSSGSDSSESVTSDGTANESRTLPVRLAARSRPDTPLEELSIRDTHYLNVLGRVIASARTSIIPDRNANQPNRAVRGSSNIYGLDQFERDCKVGAAGELFVFELLSHLDPALPNFSRANWQSNMRRYVTVHPDYANMSPWTGRETSDITYMDTQGVLTDLLIRNHYLDGDRWTGRTPKYFIEVKTTTSTCDAPFYMSNAQYQRIRVIKDPV
ncbi:hypothetical protein INS49_003636 [Diaporthe citri]|uniref:uncharacterized protein n=1 Tax=Diaporthe citri TaxID=83186 RepID=UPI001C825151|nr:uncharacterized protein INS49_003636 [Diaporthe citri]KAG6355673.1 hypothetical protein INS49_003636 [Diaporthe citri]